MKPFKTISLVDRLKASSYDNISAKPSTETTQGAIDLKNNTAPRKNADIQIKALPDSQRRNEELIKAIQKTRSKSPLPPVGQFSTPPLTSFIIPKADIKFGKTMQLEDRLKQSSKVENTSHLPHFFLSDTYVGYVKIKPLGIFNHTSKVVIPKFRFVGNKGEVNINPWVFNPLANQGAISINGGYISNIVIHKPKTSVLISQGTFFTNGAFISQTTIGQTISQDAILNGQGAIFSNGSFTSVTVLNKPVKTQNQGGLDPIKSISPLVVRLYQGLVIDNSGTLRSYTKPAKPNDLPKPETTAPTLQQTNFSALLYNQGSIILKSEEYLANRAISILLPRVEHGSAYLQRITFSTEVFNQGSIVLQLSDFQNKSFNGQTLLKAQGEDWFGYNRPAVGETEISKLLTNQLSDSEAKNLLRGVIRGWKYEKTNTRQGTAPDGNVRVVNQSIPSAWNENSKAVKPGLTERRTLGIKPDGDGSDFITLQIDKVSGGSIKFKALITSFSDSWSPSWTDQNYVGRQDTLKVFKGVTRSVSLAFKVVAWSDATTMFQKLEELAKITSVGSPTGTGYVKGPLIKITVGKLFDKVYCACNSLKIDFNPTEFSWDIEKQLPMLADISMDVSILTSNNAQMLNADTNRYYNY
jgi:hypothetical protein